MSAPSPVEDEAEGKTEGKAGAALGAATSQRSLTERSTRYGKVGTREVATTLTLEDTRNKLQRIKKRIESPSTWLEASGEVKGEVFNAGFARNQDMVTSIAGTSQKAGRRLSKANARNSPSGGESVSL